MHRTIAMRLAGVLLLSSLFNVPMSASAQGCSQCRETVGQTPVRTQTAYRRAILLMVFAGGSIFTAGIFVLRRYR